VIERTRLDGATRAVGFEPARSSAHRARVLLAEDDDDVRDAISSWLDLFGYEVIPVTTGAELLERMGSWLLENGEPPCDAIVTDVRMPGFNGLNIVEGLRDSGWTRPIVVISAFGDDAMRARIQGMDHVQFLAKPFDPDSLVAAVSASTSEVLRGGSL